MPPDVFKRNKLASSEWFCKLNADDPERSSCSAEEQDEDSGEEALGVSSTAIDRFLGVLECAYGLYSAEQVRCANFPRLFLYTFLWL